MPVPGIASIIKSARSQAKHNGGDNETLNRARAIVREYGGLDTPQKPDVNLAAEPRQIVADSESNGRTELVMFWVAHSGLGFALEAFAIAA